MRVRSKTLVITVATVTALTAVLGATLRLVLLRSFTALEKAEARRNVQRVVNAVADDLSEMDATAADWAHWDDTYRFIEDVNPLFIQDNLTDSTFDSLRLNYMLFIDSSGRIVRGDGFDLQRQTPVSVPADLERAASGSSPLVNHSREEDSTRGIVVLSDGPLLVASRPILDSHRRGPVRGALVIGRYLNAHEINRLAHMVRVPIRVIRVEETGLPDDFDTADTRTARQGQVLVRPVGRDTIAAYTMLEDIHGDPGVVLRAEMPRELYRQARVTILYVILSLLVVGVVTCLVIIWLVERALLSRLVHLSDAVRRIGMRGDASARVTPEGGDELADLAQAVNTMLQALDRSQEALSESERRLRTILDSVQIGVVIIDEETHRIVSVNAAAARMIGGSAQEIVGRICHKYICPAEKGRCPISDLGQTVDHAECILLTGSGQAVPVIKTAVSVSLDGRRYVLENFVDISDRKRAEDTIRHHAYHDTLTDLPNRLLFQDRLTQALARARRSRRMLAVLFLDLDRFKNVNDTYGHAVGDAILREVAERLQADLREEDAIARLGGDEFAVLLPEIGSADEAAVVARKILQTLRRQFSHGSHRLLLTTSIGISVSPRDGDDGHSLLQSADAALYHAKQRGRDTFQFYTASMRAQTRDRLALENGLHHALELGELVVHYQPQVDIASRRIIGVESLVRWQHPEHGLIPAERFIGIAEDNGLVDSIGEWVLRQACAQGRDWQRQVAETYDLTVAVNLSARQFHQRDLTRVVADALRESDFDPARLVLEIAESGIMWNVDLSINTMRRLKQLGVSLAIDDFGLGHSSLVHLKQFPVDALKMDRSFIRELADDPDVRAITAAVIAMGRSLNLRVIAEGVETEAQLSFLRSAGCDAAQGYLFSRPVPAGQIPELLSQGAPLSALLPSD
jgi:diguanylate cyclase (GGDEF)-like protein/PAS domain S-box-containing protein